MVVASPDASAAGRKTRGRTACKPCRQAKLKCGIERPPCPRCARLGMDCTWDPSFKRTKNQDRVSQLEENVKQLKSALGEATGHSPSALANPQAGSGSRSQSESHAPPPPPATESWGHPKVLNHVRTPMSQGTYDSTSQETHSEFRVLDVKLSLQDAESLFRRYFERYHHFTPMLDMEISLEAYYKSSELLFWTIISVASRDSQPERDFLARLSPYLTSSLGQMILGQPLRLPQIQALLLLSLWPAKNVTWWTDRSLTLSHLAVMGAMQLGINNPFFESEYTMEKMNMSDEDRQERTRTWVVCLVTAQSMAMDFGTPTKLPFDNWSISSICSTTSALQIPAELQHNLMIQRLGYFAFEALSHCVSPETGLYEDHILADLLDKYNHDLANLVQPEWSLQNRLRLATVQLHLQCMYFHLSLDRVTRKDGILQAYSTAINVINMIVSEDGSSEILSYSPRTTLRMIILAAVTVFKVLHSSYGLELDYGSGKTLYHAIILCVRQQAVQYKEKDQPDRIKDIFRELWKFGEDEKAALCAVEPTLTVRTRLGASLIYDCLNIRRARKRGERNPCLDYNHSAAFGTTTTPGSQGVSATEASFPFDPDTGEIPEFDFLVSDYLTFPWGGDYSYPDPLLMT